MLLLYDNRRGQPEFIDGLWEIPVWDFGSVGIPWLLGSFWILLEGFRFALVRFVT